MSQQILYSNKYKVIKSLTRNKMEIKFKSVFARYEYLNK